MNIEELKQALAAYKENARTKSIGLAMSSYRLDRMLHDNAEELVRLAEIGERVERGEYIHRDSVIEAEHEADEERQ